MESLPVPSISFFGYILPFLAVLTVVVFFHELGHFLVARWNKVKVDAFSVGFGPELFGRTDKHGTRRKFCAIPLGGYVKFQGDADGASTPDFEKAAQMSDEEREGSFIHKRVGQRAAVVVAGPVANFILAILIFSMSFMILGRYVSDPVVSQVVADSPASEAGFQKGDLVLAVDGTTISAFSDIARIVAPNPERELTITIRRNGEIRDIPVTPRRQDRTDRFGNTNAIGIIGIMNDPNLADGRVIKSGPVEAVGQAVGEIWYIMKTTVLFIKDIIIGHQSAKQLSGPVGIAKASGQVATLGFPAIFNWIGYLSVAIGFFNLFPIPLLDGGHLVFYFIEAVKGSPVNEKAQEASFKIGLSLLMMLMVFVTWNDTSDWFARIFETIS